jgi:hypothetical protein
MSKALKKLGKVVAGILDDLPMESGTKAALAHVLNEMDELKDDAVDFLTGGDGKIRIDDAVRILTPIIAKLVIKAVSQELDRRGVK